MKKYIIIIYLSFLLELAFITFWRGKLGVYVSPVILLLASMAVGILPIIFMSKLKLSITIKEINTRNTSLLVSLVYISFSVFSFLIFRNIMIAYPIDPSISDVIPTVQVMSERFIEGNFPYEIITTYGYHIPPTYFTMQWLPFIVSAYYNFDPRFVVIVIWLLVMAVYTFTLLNSKSSLLKKLIFTALPFIVLIIFMLDMPSVFGQTIELLPTSYYIFFIVTLFSTSLIFRAGGVILPLLSRYSFVFWLPFYFLLQFFRDQKWKSILSGVYVLLLVSILYFIPFLKHDTSIIKKGYDYYTEAAVGEWNLKDWQQADDKPLHLFRGIGFAGYYYDFAKGDIQDKLTSLKRTHLSLSILVVLIMGLLYFRFKNKVADRLYLLLSLKIYLTVFYAFIQVPYVYLQMVPLFLSVMIITSISIETKKAIVSLPAINESEIQR